MVSRHSSYFSNNLARNRLNILLFNNGWLRSAFIDEVISAREVYIVFFSSSLISCLRPSSCTCYNEMVSFDKLRNVDDFVKGMDKCMIYYMYTIYVYMYVFVWDKHGLVLK